MSEFNWMRLLLRFVSLRVRHSVSRGMPAFAIPSSPISQLTISSGLAANLYAVWYSSDLLRAILGVSVIYEFLTGFGCKRRKSKLTITVRIIGVEFIF